MLLWFCGLIYRLNIKLFNIEHNLTSMIHVYMHVSSNLLLEAAEHCE